MTKIAIDKDRMRGIMNAFAYLVSSTDEFDSEREKLNDDYFAKLAKINNRADKFQDEWANQMDRDFPGWRSFVLDSVVDSANS